MRGQGRRGGRAKWAEPMSACLQKPSLPLEIHIVFPDENGSLYRKGSGGQRVTLRDASPRVRNVRKRPQVFGGSEVVAP